MYFFCISDVVAINMKQVLDHHSLTRIGSSFTFKVVHAVSVILLLPSDEIRLKSFVQPPICMSYELQ